MLHIPESWLVTGFLAALTWYQQWSMTKGMYSLTFTAHMYLRVVGWLVFVATLAGTIAMIVVPGFRIYGKYALFGCTATIIVTRLDVLARVLADARRKRAQRAVSADAAPPELS